MTKRRNTVRASSGPSATSRNARAKHHLVQAAVGSCSLCNAARMRARCSSGRGIVAAIRTVAAGAGGPVR